MKRYVDVKLRLFGPSRSASACGFGILRSFPDIRVAGLQKVVSTSSIWLFQVFVYNRVQHIVLKDHKIRLGIFADPSIDQDAIRSKRAKPMPYADEGGCTSILPFLAGFPHLCSRELSERHLTDFSEIHCPNPVTRKSHCCHRSRASRQ